MNCFTFLDTNERTHGTRHKTFAIEEGDQNRTNRTKSWQVFT